MLIKVNTIVNHVHESIFTMSQPNKDRDGLPAPSPSASVSSYLVRMESAINPAASANGDTLAAHLSVTQSREKYNDSDRAQGLYDVKDVDSSLVDDDHSFNDRDDEDDGAIVLHRSVESLGGDGYVPTIHDDHDDTPIMIMIIMTIVWLMIVILIGLPLALIMMIDHIPPQLKSWQRYVTQATVPPQIQYVIPPSLRK